MKKYFALLLIIACGILTFAQEKKSDVALLEMAKATLKAHGGEKFIKVKTLVLRGGVEVSAPGSPQTLPAAFAIVVSGDKYRLDIQSAFFNFRQMSDGDQTFSSIAGLSLPPITRTGLQVIAKIEDAGYIVSALPEKFKKKKGFRVTSPEGYFSDFQIDEKTNLVKEYESNFELDGRAVSTSVAIDKYRDIDGVFINEKFSQRLDLGQTSSYANFNAKEILINSEVANDVFTMAQ